MAFTAHFEKEVLFHTSSILEHEDIVHGFSTRVGGVSTGHFASLNLRISCGDEEQRVTENYRRFCAALGTQAERCVLSKQVHEDTIRVVSASDAGKGLFRPRDYAADALVTNEPGLNLMVFSADCGIFLFHDPVSKCIGAVHAGWRGTALGLPAKMVAEMGRLYGAKPENIRVAVGAGIGPCCFETDDDVPDAMRKAFGDGVEAYFEKRGAKWQIDLQEINLWQLSTAGIRPEHLDACKLCTACHGELYWSHRVVGDKRGVQAAMIGLRGGERA